jgi:hypothetical protein
LINIIEYLIVGRILIILIIPMIEAWPKIEIRSKTADSVPSGNQGSIQTEFVSRNQAHGLISKLYRLTKHSLKSVPMLLILFPQETG